MKQRYVKNRRYAPGRLGNRMNDRSYRRGLVKCGCGGALAPADLQLLAAIFGVKSARCEVHLLRALRKMGFVPGTPLAEQDVRFYCACPAGVRRAQCVDATGKVVGSPKTCSRCGGIF